MNPFLWSDSARYIDTAVVSLDIVDSEGETVSISNLSTPVQLDMKVDSSQAQLHQVKVRVAR